MSPASSTTTCFCYTAPSPPDLYPLSLHDALPISPMTPTFKEAPPENFKSTAVWKVAEPADNMLRAKWWGIFGDPRLNELEDRKSTRLNSSHVAISYAVFCLKKKKKQNESNVVHK